MKKRNSSTIILILVFIIGLSLMLYPSFSNYWNSFHASEAIINYENQAKNLDTGKQENMLSEAAEYNKSLLDRSNPYLLSEEQRTQYSQLLDITGNGIMGYIEISAIGVSLPIYHGTDENVLQVAVGHLDWTSLPVGGSGTHCVLSGHRGLPSAKLFTDLDKLVIGDTFILRVLDEVLTYEIDQILIVEPHVTENLLIEEGKDYCTLVTCTPYGINTHRMLIRGHRIENQADTADIRVTADAIQIEPLTVAPIIASPILLLLLFWLLIKYRKKN